MPSLACSPEVPATPAPRPRRRASLSEPSLPLGKQIKVTADGTVTAGQPATIAVKTGQKVDDVSGWLGNQADIANKVTCQLQTDEPKPDYDCMITIPSTVPAGAMIWIQVTSNGNPESGSVRVRRHRDSKLVSNILIGAYRQTSQVVYVL